MKKQKLETHMGLFQAMLGGSAYMTSANQASCDGSDGDNTVAAYETRVVLEKQTFLAAKSTRPHTPEDLLKFYSKYEETLPVHTLAFRSNFAACGTEAGIERVFSKAGLVNTPHRNRLKPKVLSAMIKINSNRDMLPSISVIYAKYKAMKK